MRILNSRTVRHGCGPSRGLQVIGPAAAAAAVLAAAAVRAQPPIAAVCFPLTPAALSDGTQIPECPFNTGPPPQSSEKYTKQDPNGQQFLDYNATKHGYHTGEDWNGNGGGSSDLNDPVHAMADGVVVYVRDTEIRDGWGKVLAIKHRLPADMGGGTIYSIYGHLEEISVALDAPVDVGDQIGTLGDANGYYLGAAHLHFEIQTGSRVDHCSSGDVWDCVGDGYVQLDETSELNLRTSPEIFLRLFGEPLQDRLPGEAHGPLPADGASVSQLPQCVAEDETQLGQCLKWGAGAWSVYFDLALNDEFFARVWKPRLPLPFCLAPGPHTWQVTAGNYYEQSAGPAWAFDYSPSLTFFREGGCEGSGPPDATTNLASGLTQASATLNMTVDPNGSATTAWFVWEKNDPTPDANQSPVPAADVGNGESPVPFSWTINNLDCGSLYYFQARAENSLGEGSGDVLAFGTDACGGGGGEQEVELITNGGFESGSTGWVRTGDFHIDDLGCPYSGSRYAFLAEADGTWGDGLVGTLSQVFTIPSTATDVELTFRYSIQTQEGSGTYDVLSVWLYNESGSTPLELLDTYSNLDAQGGCGSGYYDLASFDLSDYHGQTVQLRFLGTTDGSLPTVFRVDKVSALATVASGGPPVVSTESADQVSTSSARLNLTVNPSGLPTEIWFDLEANDSTPDIDTDHIAVGSGTTTEDVSITVTGLDCDTHYYFEANAANDAGSEHGLTLSFYTEECAGGPPTADTDPAQAITTTSARLTADILPNGLSTDAWFEWGETGSLGNSTPQQAVGSGTSWVDFEFTLDDLECGTHYYFEAHAENAQGEDDGATLSFTTLDCGSPIPNDELLLFSTRQACDGAEPAVLLGWTMPADVDPVVTVRRIDGAYTATVDTAVEGPRHVVNSGLMPGSSYGFVVEALAGGVPVVSNTAAVRALSAQCAFPVEGSEAPHPPLLWADPPYCEGGVPKVRLHWTGVSGADHYNLRRISLWGGYGNFTDLSGFSFVDATTAPGTAPWYYLEAVGPTATTYSWDVSLLIPGTICSGPGALGPFTASLGAPVCVGGRGESALTWTAAAGALPDYRYFELYNHLLMSGSDNEEDFQAVVGDVLEPGHVVRLIVQAESATTPGQYREARQVARLIPTDICPATLPPTAQTQGPPNLWVEEDRALVRASIKARGSQTTAYIEWGPDTAYGSATPPRDVGAGYEFVTLGEELTGLACNATYHFRAVATNGFGTSFGVDRALATEPCSNEPPVAANDNYATLEDLVLVVGPPGILANDSDPDDDGMSAVLVTDVSNGTLSFASDGSFTYAPAQDFSGVDGFSYRASDGLAESGVATVTITVAAVDDPPFIQVTQPDGVGDLADQVFIIEWIDDDIDSDASIALSYSATAQCTDPAAIVSDLSEDSVTDSYTWNTSGLPNGEYWVLGSITDGTSPATSCSAGPVTVAHSPEIFADGFESGDTSAWSPPAP